MTQQKKIETGGQPNVRKLFVYREDSNIPKTDIKKLEKYGFLTVKVNNLSDFKVETLFTFKCSDNIYILEPLVSAMLENSGGLTSDTWIRFAKKLCQSMIAERGEGKS